MNINEMEGRELSEAVATKVMGWTALREPGKAHLWMPPEHFISGWRPDRDIAAAMQVLLKLEELEPTATIRLSNGDGDSCDVDILTDIFCELNAVHISLDGGLELLPLAISRAALMAVEAE